MRLPELSSRQAGENGSALMACVILSFVLMASILWYSKWVWNRSQVDVPGLTSQRAMQYADSCVNSTSPWLKDPTLKQRLPPGTSANFTLDMPNGHCDVAIYRNGTNTNFVDTYTTGYYYVATGTGLDSNGNRSSIAAINTKFMVSNVAEYLTAVPGTLEVAYGANATNGILYGGSLTFDGPTGGIGTDTQVGTAYFFNMSSPSVNPSYVHFQAGSVQQAQQLAYPPSFATLNAAMTAEYQSIASAVTPDFQGTVGAPPTHVYYSPASLDIATTQPLVVQGVYVIYVASSVFIHNSIVLADANSWIAILAQTDIHIAADAPSSIQLAGNYVTNGLFQSDGTVPTGRSFSLNGGIVSLSGIAISPGFDTRSYTYAFCNDPNLKLPNITQILQYTVTGGSAASH